MKLIKKINVLLFISLMIIFYTGILSFFIANAMLFLGKHELLSNLTYHELFNQYFDLLDYNQNHVYSSLTIVLCMFCFILILLRKSCKKEGNNVACN